MRLRVWACAISIIVLAFGCEEKQSTLRGIHPDSLEEAGHELYKAGDYREALALYTQGIAVLKAKGITTAEDSTLMADLLIRKAYCNYHLEDRQDEDRTWLAAWRYVQADRDTADLVMYAQRIASLHSRRNQLYLEIEILRHADTLAAAAGLDSLRNVVEEDLKGAALECMRDPTCSLPSTQEDTSGAPMHVIIFAVLVGLIIGLWIDPSGHVARYQAKIGQGDR